MKKAIPREDVRRFEEIRDEIKELVYEARGMLPRNSIEYERAKSYWIPHILMALDSDHDYLGGSMFTMQDTINDLTIEDEDYDDENDT